MRLEKIIAELGLEVITGSTLIDEINIEGGYCGDLMSDVLANAEKNYIWVTIQTHSNIIAVAVLKEIPAIILANGKQPAQDTVSRAEENKIVLLRSDESGFNIVGKLYSLGINA